MSESQGSEDASSKVTADPTVWCEDGHIPLLLDENDECPHCGQGYDVSITVEVVRK